MAFLKLNNWTIPVKDATPKKNLDEGGGRGRRGSGALKTHRNWMGRRWEVTTTPQVAATAEAMEHWVTGRGHVWPFDYDEYSFKGRPPSSGYTATASIVTGVTKFSLPTTSFMFLGSAGGNIQFTCPADISAINCTLSFWMWINDGTYAAWRHYVKRVLNSTVTTRVDNGAGPANPSNYSLTLGSSVHTFSVSARNAANSANASVWIEDLVLVPYAMTDAQITAINTSTEAFGQAPMLRMTGDIIGEPGPVYVQGTLKSVEYIQGKPSTTWLNNMRALTFELHEVDPFVERTTA